MVRGLRRTSTSHSHAERIGTGSRRRRRREREKASLKVQCTVAPDPHRRILGVFTFSRAADDVDIGVMSSESSDKK